MAASTVLTPVVGSPALPHPFRTPSPAFQNPFPTPSPFRSVSAASTGLNKPILLRNSNLALRSLAFIFSFVSAISLAAHTPHNANGVKFNFLQRSEFRYCISAAIIACLYSAFQLFKGIWDIAFKGFIVSEMASDYITFILDQVVTYLLLSSSSVSVLGIQSIPRSVSTSTAIVSVSMLFVAFAAFAVSTLLSGYKLCKRIIW